MGALSVTGNPKYREAFEPLIGNVKFADLNDFDSVLANVTDKTCAIMLETVQGEGGMLPATEEFLKKVRALCDEVEEKLEEAGLRPHHIEGKTTGWVCLDYGSVIIHIFTRDQREFYGLDKMWSDGEIVNMEEILTNALED